MRIGVLGTTSMQKNTEMLGKSLQEYQKFLDKVAVILARLEAEIIVVPDKGGTSEHVALRYLKEGGKKVTGIIPLQDKEFGYEWLNREILNEEIDCLTWRNAPEKLCEESDLMLALSYGPGVLIEICYTKWFKSKVIVLEEYVSGKLPIEAEKGLEIKYIRLKELEKEIKEQGTKRIGEER